jgi:hypothetical protein
MLVPVQLVEGRVVPLHEVLTKLVLAQEVVTKLVPAQLVMGYGVANAIDAHISSTLHAKPKVKRP